MKKILLFLKSKISSEQIFMLSVLLVNGGNYLYNLILGRYLGPEKFSDAAILITFLLVLSFVAMTFQLVTAKFSVVFEGNVFFSFVSKMYKKGLIFGCLLGLLIILASSALQTFFNTTTSSMFLIFGFGVPFYFLMSINRGVYQGKKLLNSLSITYQTEMLSRLIITLVLLYFLDFESSALIALGILISLVFGLIPFDFKNISLKPIAALDLLEKKQVQKFFLITAFYELTQIIINNSDILLVKHYFDAYEAGLYASLALIGRVVYFIAWMFVMLLLPTVVQLHKEGKPTVPILMKYVVYIALIAATIIIGCYFFPTQIILVLFGDNYIEIAPMLWKYATATGIFAISNIFAYYYLSLDKYFPVFLSGIFGMMQIVLIVFYHNSLEEVVYVQIIAMILLMVVQLSYFFIKDHKKEIHKKKD